MSWNSWKPPLCIISLALAAMAGAGLQQRINNSSLGKLNSMNLETPLAMPRLPADPARGVDWPVRTVADGALKAPPWVGVVSRVEGENAFITGGSDHGLAVGMLLDVALRGKRLVDPETGLTIGSVTEKIGQVRVVEVEPDVSKMTIVEGCEDLRPGVRVELRP